MKINIYKLAAVFLSVVVFFSCSDYLDLKPDKKMAIPSKTSDLQLLLDNFNSFNNTYPYAFGILSDAYYVSSEQWKAVSKSIERNLYIWQPDDNSADFWSTPYRQIYSLNVILEEAAKIHPSNAEQPKLAAVKGAAKFLRAYNYFALTQLFTKPFVTANADTDLGLPLHVSADYSVKSVRSSLAETYQLIIRDVEESIQLLPKTTLLQSRPSISAAYGLLAKIYLAMGDYDNAGQYAEMCLKEYNSLLDYNEIEPTSIAPFPRFNNEIIFLMRSLRPSMLVYPRAQIDTLLYSSYDENDLRKQLFFTDNPNGGYAFKGDYDGWGISNNGYVFGGIVTDEIYLIAAECHARRDQLEKSADYLNQLLRHRWKVGTFVSLRFETKEEAIKSILQERKKQLLFRDSRWIDIRRLSLEPEFAINASRYIDGVQYDLNPSSPYVLLIPRQVIERSGMQQN